MHVLDEDKRLAGVVSVITLLQAEPSESVGALMDSDPVRVSADADLTDIALLMADFNLYSIPSSTSRTACSGWSPSTTCWRPPSPRTGAAANPRPVRSAKSLNRDDRNAPVPGGEAP